MPEPISFTTATNTLSLPLLFPGQAQKEFYVNQSLTLIDALLHRTVLATLASPPANAADGQTYRVADAADGAWSGHDETIAIFIGGDWQFIPPVEGMQVYDQDAGQFACYRSGWVTVSTLSAIQGGA
ncbi:MAG: DUF2793 domain-containing protein, partial [Pseudomonadota bacterium]